MTAAVGYGIYPSNTSIILKSPEYLKVKKEGRLDGSHWDFLRSTDLEAAYFKWINAPEPAGIRLFYQGLIFERAKMYHEALKATLNETYTKQINEMQAKYDAGVKDEQIKRLSHAKEMIEAENERSRLMNYFMIFSFVSVCVIGIVIARNLILKQRISNKVLSEKNAITQLQKEQVERANMVLVAEKIAAQYEVLKSKINPHFLFNSLSTLSSLIAKSKESALHFVDNFSELYRRILETTEQQLISLEDEVEVVKRYLFLQPIAMHNHL